MMGAPPAIRSMRALLACLVPLVLAGCLASPRGIEGVATDEAWTALPLRAWLAEGRATPEAVVACLSPDCPHRLAVAIIALTGEDARQAAAILRDPGPLAAQLRERDAADTDKRRAAIRTQVAVRPLDEAGLPGFVLTLSREDGARPPAHAAALGRLAGGSLSLVLAIGTDEAATVAAARQAAAARSKT